jgi:DNA polymerase III sliding clamp (beta) subunit (PCNA family)
MNRADLVRTLELVRPALAKDNVIPIYQCFCFEDGQVYAYNDAIGIIGPAEAEGTDPFAVHGNTLLGLLSNSSAEAIELAFKGDTLELKLGKTVAALPFFAKENFLFDPTKATQSDTLPITVTFIEAMKVCLETVSHDETQRALMGLWLDGNQIYSCNGDMLTRITLKSKPKQARMLPTGFCQAVIKIWESLNLTKGTLKYSDEWLIAEFDEWQIWGRVPEINEMPAFDTWVKRTGKGETKPVPTALNDALSRARVLADPESQKTTISIGKGKVHLTTSTHMGDVDDFVTFKDHPDISCAISAAHLQQALVHCDQVAFHEDCVVLEKAPNVFMLMGTM